jgi:acetylglutamate kinase
MRRMMKALQDKAAVLIEALPWIQRFQGETFVVKYGGHAMTDPDAARGFARDVVLLRSIGIRPIVVHGGGPQIKRALERFGIESKFKSGMRITDEATMDVVRMVLVGEVNQDIVALINHFGGKAVGLSGADASFLRGERITVEGEDIGRVGKVTAVDGGHVALLDQSGYIPVIAPIAIDTEGKPLNVNADLAAGAVAARLDARKLLLMTDIEGVRGADGDVIRSLPRRDAQRLIDEGVISGGMIPKIGTALDALDAGVRKVHIVDGRVAHALLLEIFTDSGVGTEVVA